MAREAIELFLREELDLILMDAHMPNMNGFDAIRAIRAHEQGSGRHIPIIMLTASVLDSDRKMCLDAGADAFVPKPIDFRLLFDRIADFFPAIDPPVRTRWGGDSRPTLPMRWDSSTRPPASRAGATRTFISLGWYASPMSIPACTRPSPSWLRANDPREAVEYLHKLKGLLGNLRIRRLPQVCAAIERDAQGHRETAGRSDG